MDANPRSTDPDAPRFDRTTLLAAARRWVVPVAAPAAIALIIAAAADFFDRPDKTRSKPAAPAAPPTADTAVPTLMSKDRPLPRFVVSVRRTGSAVVVRDVRTFASLGQVAVPPKRRFQQVAAAGANSYIVSSSARDGTVFYRLRLAGDGRPAELAALPGVRVPGTSTMWSDMATNQDGTLIAYVSYGAKSGKIAVDVVSAATGMRRTWTTSHEGRIGGLSWAGNTLSFVWTPTRGATVVRRQVRTLDTTRPGGGLGVSRPVLTLPDGADTAVLSRDGATIVAGVTNPSGLTLTAYSAADGRQTKVLWRRAGDAARVTRLVPDGAGGDLIAAQSTGRLLVGVAHGPGEFAAGDIADLAW
ncbi:MAG TPA: hypothetical protein VH912_25440 [Streptosporangiaceae bacterium]|jgi:hypothetical protein